MSGNLYELSSDFAMLLDMAENEEIDVELIKDTLESIESGIEDKFENIAKLIKNLNGKSEIFKAEETRIKTRRLSMEKKVDWLKGYLLTSLDLTRKKKIDAGTFTVRKQKNPQGVLVSDIVSLNPIYVKYGEPKADLKLIKEDLQLGKKVEGAELAPDTYHVRIQ